MTVKIRVRTPIGVCPQCSQFIYPRTRIIKLQDQVGNMVLYHEKCVVRDAFDLLLEFVPAEIQTA